MKYLLFFFALISPIVGMGDSKIMYIYQDADLSSHPESAEAIQKGIELAFNEIGYEIEGYKVGFKYLDHRGSVARSKRNYQRFLDDPKALAIYSGIHSPPLIKNRTFINEQKALTLVPWAAGGPITRHPSAENWVFRLSVDDAQAAPVIIDFALNKKSCVSPHLLLEKTPWGDSNLKSMSKALRMNGIDNFQVTRFSWSIREQGARTILRDVRYQGNDCIVLVANSGESVVFLQEMLKYPEADRLPVISHWGITGGNFADVITAKNREGLDLHFIQSCFAFTSAEQSVLAQTVFYRLNRYTDGEIEQPGDLKSAVGFIHAYDLSRILIQAIKQAGLTGDVSRDRNAIRLALENVHTPVEGLVKTYNSPFSVFNKDTNPNAHEALNASNYCMGRFGSGNEVLIVSN